jgi:hypothetical protein
MTVYDVRMQYESRLQALHAGIGHARLSYHLGAVVLALATILFLTLGGYSIRQQVAYRVAVAPDSGCGSLCPALSQAA